MVNIPIYREADRGTFCARWMQDGARKRLRNKDLRLLKENVRKTARRLESGSPDLDNLTEEQSILVREVLRRGVTLGDLDKIQQTSDKVIEDAVKSLRDSVRESTGGPYQQSLRTHLNQFTKAFPGRKLASFTVDELDDWLLKVAPAWRNRRNKRACLVSVFNFARDKGWIPLNARHAAERTTQAKPPKKKKPVSTWSPEEMVRILEIIPSDYLPWVVLVGFGGLRTEELFPWDRSIGDKKPVLQWEDIRWDANKPVIYVSDEVAKEDTEREIPLTPQLLEWLKPFANREGQICPNRAPGRPQLVGQQQKEGVEDPDRRSVTQLIGDELGVAYRRNAFRHSFGTYAVRKTKAVGEVALLMGNSEGVVRRHYNDVKGRTDADAEEWFGIMPKNVKRKLRVVV